MKPKSSKGQKYLDIFRPIWDDIYSGYSGNGMKTTVKTTVIPSDPCALTGPAAG